MKAKRAKREHRQYDSLPIIAYNQELQREIKSIRKDYSFTANPNLSTRSNVANRLRQLTLVELFNNCLNRSCHNLCKTTKVPRAATRLLGLGLKFCVTDKPPPTNMSDIDIKRFRENTRTKYFFIDKTESALLCLRFPAHPGIIPVTGADCSPITGFGCNCTQTAKHL